MLDIELCRSCLHLADGIKMYPIEHTRYHEIFERYTQDKMDMNEELPYSVCYLCNAVLDKLYDFLKNMIDTEIYLKETLRNTSKLTFKSVEKFKREKNFQLHNLSHRIMNEIEVIKEAENKEMKDLETSKHKSKLPAQESKSAQRVQKESSEHSEEKSLENDQQKPPEENFRNHPGHTYKDSEATVVQDDYPSDDDEIEEDMRLVWSPEIENESPSILNMEIDDASFIENNNSSEQSNHKSESSFSNKQTKTPDTIDSFLLCAQEYRPPEEIAKSSNENFIEEAVTTNLEICHRPFLELIEERRAIEKQTQEKEMDMSDELPYSPTVCYVCIAVLNRLDNFLKNMIDPDIVVKKALCNTYKLIYERVKKLRREMISRLHKEIKVTETKEIKNNETRGNKEVETERIKEAENEEIKDLETPQQKLKLPEQASKSPHRVQKEWSDCEAKSLANDQQKPPEENFKNQPEQIDSETMADQDDHASDDGEIEEDMRLVWSPEIDNESPSILNMEIDDAPFIENNNSSEQSNHKSQSSFSNKQTKTPDPIDSFLLCAQKYRHPEELVKSFNENVIEEAVTTNPEINHRPYLELIEFIAIEKYKHENKVKTPKPVKFHNAYLQFLKECTATEGTPQEKTVKTPKPVKYHEPFEFIEQHIHTEENPPNKRLKTSEQRVNTPNPEIHQNLQVIEIIPVKETEHEQTPRQIEIDDPDNEIMEDGSVVVKIESVDEEFRGSFEENQEGNNVLSDKETFNSEETEEIHIHENYGDKVTHATEDVQKTYETDNKMELQKTERKKEDKKFVCDLCSKRFDTKIEVRKHAVHHIL